LNREAKLGNRDKSRFVNLQFGHLIATGRYWRTADIRTIGDAGFRA
jgi:hypothetical protein